MTEKQNEEMLALADRIRDMAYSGVNDFDNFSSYKLDLIQDCAKKLQASLATGVDAGHARLMDALKLFLGHLRAESRLIPNAYEIHIKYDDYKKMSDAYFGEKIRTSTVLKKLGGPS